MSSPSPTPSPTPWATTPYEPTSAVDQFHGLLRMRVAGVFTGAKSFPVDDPADTDYYASVAATAFIPLGVVLIFMIPFYWTFLCCRNGCCHDTFYRRFGCMCCSSAKGEGCLRNGHPKGHPLLARGVLLVSFCLVIGLNVGIDNVRLEVSELLLKVSELLDGVSDMMSDLNDYALDMNVTAGKISSYASALDCADDYSDQTESISDASGTIAEYAVLISDSIGTLPRELGKMSDNIAENGDTYVNYAGLALAALGVLYAVLGLLGTLCFEGKQNPVRCATGWLATTNAFGVLMLIIIALLLAAELTAGLVLGDFCAADVGPSNAFVAIMQSQQDDDNNEGVELIDFYATCQGTNPMTKYLDAQQAAVTNMTDILDEYKDLFIHENMCCDSSYDTNNISPDTVAASCTFYSASNPSACTTDSVCDYNGGTNNGGCVAAGGCLNASYTGIVNEINYLALDDDGPLVGFFGEFECAEINPKVAKLINEIVCDSLVESLWWMVAVHISVLILMYIVMCLSSFARQAIYESTLDKDQEAEDVKENYANPGESCYKF
uniref:Uncharacterized protein n=1 Tax=Florenciella parvula TaxID=236787 RepID=A0A7S2GB14_9STRA|mmetsp:Transcript_7746/g.16316  ORF Transcript_7746/g.16316 Transcript_7746/m.16316 type:complete len:551 (+) Transcript_7746:167-1819(+)